MLHLPEAVDDININRLLVCRCRGVVEPECFFLQRVKIELDIEGISWYIETTLETDTVPAVGDIIIVDKDCISERDSAELWKTPSNQVFKWADEEDDAPVMVWFDCDTEMLVNKRTWKYDIEEEETVCILGVKFIHYEDL